jgi:hypothetical protein
MERWTPTVEQLAEIIEMHRKWLYGEEGGKRANLRAANLSAADLRAANLRAANLSAADLRAADLRDADLSDANLSAANLSAANLSAANLRAANLSAANLRDANLRAADLRDANLRDANLRAANLTYIRDDLWAVLSSAPAEVEGLRLAIVEGRIDGSTYTGSCACLVGTIANICHCNYESLPTLKPNSSRPAEVWFLNIRPGDTPETNQFARFALEWLDTWLVNVRAAFVVETAAA